jgi:hypothetical protein
VSSLQKKYSLNMTLPKTWSSFIWTWPTATPRHRTFLSWNLMVERTSVILLLRSSAWATGVGNLPAVGEHKKKKKETRRQNAPLDKPGPNKRGICLINVSEARKASYFLASFLTNFLFLFSLIERIMSILSSTWANPKNKTQNALLQIVHRHVLELNLLGPIDVSSIGENAD